MEDFKMANEESPPPCFASRSNELIFKQRRNYQIHQDNLISRFKLPEINASEESFTSALSDDLSDQKERAEEASILKKYISSPLPRNFPRSSTPIPCFIQEEMDLESNQMLFATCLASASSSKQLFEILRNSPTPSDADLNLIRAAYMRKLGAVKEAIRNGANVNTFRDRQTPLMIATEFGDVHMVRYLLSVPKVNPNFQNVFGQTPVILAVRNSFDEVLQLLLNHNADVNLTDNIGRTALHGALFQQRPHIVKLLLAFGADYEMADVFGERCMYTASVKKPHLECLKVLLSVGASPEYINQSGLNLLSRVILNCTSFNIVKMLVQYGANVNAVDLHSGKTPLHYTSIANDHRIAEYLLNHGANPNVKTCYNFTPYDEAIFHKSLEVAERLFPVTKNASLKALNLLRSQKL